VNIAGTEYNLKHKALEIYISGCNGPYCAGCHNVDLWDFNLGWDVYDWEDALHHAINHESMVEQVWILGGEPQDQDMDALNFLLKTCKQYGKTIVLFTRYMELNPKLDKTNIDYVKHGPYDMYSRPYIEPILNIEMASMNQCIVKVEK